LQSPYSHPPPIPNHTLSLHDALPIFPIVGKQRPVWAPFVPRFGLGLFRFSANDSLSRDLWRSLCRSFRLCRSSHFGRSCFLNPQDRKSTRLNSSHVAISYAVFCL